MTDLSTGNARQRAARLLLHLEDKQGEVRLFSREDLGSMIGLTTETASRTIADFKRKGLITEMSANHFQCNHDGLEAVADNS